MESEYTMVVASDIYPHPSYANHRGKVGNVDDLVASISAVGLLDPLQVFPREAGGYFLKRGYRRFKALCEIQDSVEKGYRGFVVPCITVDQDEEALDIARAVASDNVRKYYARTTIGLAIRNLTAAHGWSIERIASAFGIDDLDDVRAYAALSIAPPDVSVRVDRGEISWTAWKTRVSKVPAVVQSEIAEMKAPTVKAVRKKIKTMAAPAEDQGRMFDDESLQAELSQAAATLKRIIRARPWGPDIDPQCRYIMNDLISFIDEEYIGGSK